MNGFNLRSPCRYCPFRSDITPYLRLGRAEEIAASIRSGGTFPCHKTIDYLTEEEPRQTERTQQCAGALIICEKEGRVPQMARIAERLGMYDASLLDMDAPVYESFATWIAAHHREAG